MQLTGAVAPRAIGRTSLIRRMAWRPVTRAARTPALGSGSGRRAEGSTMEQPLALGYLRVAAEADARDVDSWRTRIAEFAEREGLTLGRVFVEVEASVTSAFAALVEAAVEADAAAVITPTRKHLGRLPGVQLAMSDLLERRTRARLLVMNQRDEPAPEHLAHDPIEAESDERGSDDSKTRSQ